MSNKLKILFALWVTVSCKPVTESHKNFGNSGSRVQSWDPGSYEHVDQSQKNLAFAEKALTSKMDRKKRQCSLSPFDVHCHGYCPKRSTRDWEKLIIYWNCSAKYKGTTYHCARNKTGQLVEACAEPERCDKGTKPIITFPPGHKAVAEVECDDCEENRYNPYEGKMSDSFSVCERARRECRRTEGQIECDIVTGIERHWTDSKCMCDVRNNYIPVFEKESTCSDDDGLRCIEMGPCPDTSDGKRQEYLLSNHSCSPVCGEGYYQRSSESDECIPKRNVTEDSNTTLDVTTDPVNIKPVTVVPVSPTVKNVTVITDVPSNGTDNGRGPPSKEPGNFSTWKVVAICVGSSVVVALPVAGILYYFCIYRRNREEENESTSSTGDPQNHASSVRLPGALDSSSASIPLLKRTNTPNGDASDGRMTQTREGRMPLTRKERKTVLDKNIRIIKELMKPTETIDKIIEHQLFQEVDRKDLRDLDKKDVTSKVNDAIWKLVHANVSCYKDFIKCLQETNQFDLLTQIQTTEDKVLSERQKKTAAIGENDDISTENSDEGGTEHDVGSEDSGEDNDRMHEETDMRENNDITETVAVENIRDNDSNTHQVSVANTVANNDSTHQVAVEKTAEKNDTIDQVSEENNRVDNNRMHNNGNTSYSAVEVLGSGICSNTDSQ